MTMKPEIFTTVINSVEQLIFGGNLSWQIWLEPKSP